MDAKKSDHAYPKHRRSSPGRQSSESVFPPLVVDKQHELPNQASRRYSSLDSRKDYFESEKEATNMVGKAALSSIPDSAHKDHTYLNSSQQKNPFAASAHSGVHGMATSSARRRVKRTKSRKQDNRDTDHMYNTRRTESAGTPACEKHSRNTDHLYNLRKVESPAETSIKRPNNRDTDHLYNLQTSKTQSHEARVEMPKAPAAGDLRRGGKKGAGRVPADVDKRVVDKDHMYQHNSRKTRGRLNKKSRATKRKIQSPENSATAVTPRSKRRAVQKVPESLDNTVTYQGRQRRRGSNPTDVSPTDVSGTVSAACAVTTMPESELSVQTVVEECVYGDKVCSISLQGEMVADPLSEHGYTTVPCKGTSVQDASSSSCLSATSSASANKRLSPGRSENDSGHMCEDDSRRSGVSHIDHMYVHADYLDTDGLGDTKGAVLSKGLAGEGYKQEHSYANSEEIRYDACMKCSQLVQHLIGTIRKQRDHIEDLKKQLQDAHAKNKLLSTMFSNQSEDVK